MKNWVKRFNESHPFCIPIVLYIATWLSTFGVGYWGYGGGSARLAFAYSAPLMIILTVHELGHYLQARRYGVPSSMPLFIPIPFLPLGTFGAVIRLRGQFRNRRALFDIGASGPLAGLVASLIFLVVGLKLSHYLPCEAYESPCREAVAFVGDWGVFLFGEPLIFQWLERLICGVPERSSILVIHPTAIAAWVGVLLTTLNLFPVGQLDGGHVLYALIGSRSKWFSRIFYGVGVVALIAFHAWQWVLFALILAGIRLQHPSTQDDATSLGCARAAVGSALLAFVAIGFTPTPLRILDALARV